MSYFKKPELNERALSILNQVIAKLAEGGFSVKLLEGGWGHVLSVKSGYDTYQVVSVEESCRQISPFRSSLTGKLVYKFPTLRLRHTGNVVASQLNEDSKDLVAKIVAKVIDRINIIDRDNELIIKKLEAEKQRKETLRNVEEDSEKLRVAYPKFANRVFSNGSLTIKFDCLSIEKAHEILTALEDKGIEV
jgi:hypothetical protein